MALRALQLVDEIFVLLAPHSGRRFSGRMAAQKRKIKILGMGNPLLDISSPVTSAFMKKYGIRPNNAILAEDKHLPMYDELSKMETVEFIGGGSTLNSIRVAQWMLQEEGSTGYMGCIGKDKYGELLATRAAEDGVNCNFMKKEDVGTGTCAVCITDKERSLVANLSAANEFHHSHLADVPLSQSMLDEADIVYNAGFFVTVSPESMMKAAEHCQKNNKVYALNFSAEFVVSFFKDKLLPIFELTTHVFTNDDEVKAFAKANDIAYKTLPELAVLISQMKCGRKEGRTVVVTQGKKPVLVAQNGKCTEYPVLLVAPEQVVDVNGAGDAFVGGFLSSVSNDRTMAECVSSGCYAARYIIQTSGTKLVGKPKWDYKKDQEAIAAATGAQPSKE